VAEITYPFISTASGIMLRRMNKPVILSDKAYAIAEERAKEYGCDSVETYLNQILEEREDDEAVDIPEWMEKAIDEGLASGPSEPLTREKLHQLVHEGIALAAQDKERLKK
jgi:hypothetical protein